jgi:hypothetical protein
MTKNFEYIGIGKNWHNLQVQNIRTGQGIDMINVYIYIHMVLVKIYIKYEGAQVIALQAHQESEKTSVQDKSQKEESENQIFHIHMTLVHR